MRNYRQFVAPFVMAVMIAAVLGISGPASADAGAPGGPHRSTCAFLSGILQRVGNADAAASLAGIFDALFGCDLSS